LAGLPIESDTFAKGFSLPVKGQPFCNIPEESEFKVDGATEAVQLP
jgi:hypothetical protein